VTRINVLTTLALTLQLATALVLGSAALAKLRDLQRFRAVLRDYAVVPPRWTSAAAILLLGIELAVAGGLFVPHSRRIAALIGAALLALFGSVIALTLRRGRAVADCGCTWSSGSTGSLAAWMAVRNFVHGALLAGSATVAVRGLSAADVLAACAAAATLTLLYHAMPGLLMRQSSRARPLCADTANPRIDRSAGWTA
jgi:hypothetical protein